MKERTEDLIIKADDYDGLEEAFKYPKYIVPINDFLRKYDAEVTIRANENSTCGWSPYYAWISGETIGKFSLAANKIFEFVKHYEEYQEIASEEESDEYKEYLRLKAKWADKEELFNKYRKV